MAWILSHYTSFTEQMELGQLELSLLIVASLVFLNKTFTLFCNGKTDSGIDV